MNLQPGKHQEPYILSLWQPWAMLLVLGIKQIETRGWSTDYRGPVYIHAGKRKPDDVSRMVWNLSFVREVLAGYYPQGIPNVEDLPYGAVVGRLALTDCRLMVPSGERVGMFDGSIPGQNEQFLGNWEPGRFAWVTSHPEFMPQPFALRGAQKLFRSPAMTEIQQRQFSPAYISYDGVRS